MYHFIKKAVCVSTAASVALLFASLAHGQVLTPTNDGNSGTSETAFDYLINGSGALTGDLIDGMTPTTTSPADAVGGFNFSMNGISDGQVDNANQQGGNDTYLQGGASFSSTSSLNNSTPPTVTYSFSNASGVNINSIQSIYGWQDNQSFSDQDYTITYTLVGSSDVHTLGQVAYNPFQPDNVYPKEGGDFNGGGPADSSYVQLGDLGLTGVSSISFQFTPYYYAAYADDPNPSGQLEQGAQLIREIEVFGEDAPEPSTWAMLLAGLVLTAAVTRRRLRS